jgi:hypothetical protein
MGLTFHYSGSIASPDLLADLIDEVYDVVKAHNWKYKIHKDTLPTGHYGRSGYDKKIYGITFTPPDCEPVNICFLSNGRMSSKVNLALWAYAFDPEEKEYLYLLSVKTQFAGVEIHMFLIELFRYLNSKYLKDFVLQDEGGYWESKDESELRKKQGFLAKAMDTMAEELCSFPMKKTETMNDYLNRLLDRVSDLNPDEEI